MGSTNSAKAIYLVSIIAAVTGLLFGFDTGIISGALLFIQQQFVLTTKMKEIIVSSVLLGAMLGTLFGGHLTDVYGRRRVILIVSLMFIVGTLVASFAATPNMIIFGRLIIGVAIGIGSYTAPLYIAEAAPMEKRGGLVTLNQLAITIGIMTSYFINLAFTDVHGSWRWMFIIGIIPAVLLLIGMLFLPESPRWLVMKGKIDAAKAILQRLRNTHDVHHEIADIQNSLKVKKASFKEVLAPWIRPVLFFGIVLGLLQQVVGINAIIYYAPTIFKSAGFASDHSSILATVCLGVTNVLATILSIYLLDKAGRRPLLLTGIAGMAVSLFVLSYVFHAHSASDILRWSAFGASFVYIISFAVSLGAVMWLMLSEIFPLEVRGTAMSLAVFSNWLWNFIVSSTFLSLLGAIGSTSTFFLYAVMCVVAFVVCYKFAPETKGVSLEKIEANIRRGLPVRHIGIIGQDRHIEQPISDAEQKTS